jgi:hypothetical protein
VGRGSIRITTRFCFAPSDVLGRGKNASLAESIGAKNATEKWAGLEAVAWCAVTAAFVPLRISSAVASSAGRRLLDGQQSRRCFALSGVIRLM